MSTCKLCSEQLPVEIVVREGQLERGEPPSRRELQSLRHPFPDSACVSLSSSLHLHFLFLLHFFYAGTLPKGRKEAIVAAMI